MHFAALYDASSAQWVRSLGYAGIAAIIFAETAFFFCFFLPGDTLLFTAGMLAAAKILNLYFLIPLIIVSAFLGYWVGYYIGLYFGRRLEGKPSTWYYRKDYSKKTHVFVQKYGKLALLLGRLIAVVRTFIPVVAGMGEMPLRSYLLFNFLGAVLWSVSIPLLGFYLGRLIPNLTQYFYIVIAGIVVVSVLPFVSKMWRR